jgi:hypothetical protein
MDSSMTRRLLHAASPLPDSTEAVVTQVIDACVQVHRELGPGLLESVYQRAVAIELRSRNIPFEREKTVPILFRNQLLCHHRLDLRASRLRRGLLMNFNVPVLKQGLRRIVLG